MPTWTLYGKIQAPPLFPSSRRQGPHQFLAKISLFLAQPSKLRTKSQVSHLRKKKVSSFSHEPKPMSTVKIQPTACALSSTVRHIGFFNLRLPRDGVVSSKSFNQSRRYGNRRALAVSMSSASQSNPLEVCVKASTTTPNKLGDCENSLSQSLSLSLLLIGNKMLHYTENHYNVLGIENLEIINKNDFIVITNIRMFRNIAKNNL